MRDRVVIEASWLDQFQGCSVEQQKEICYRMLQYGLFEKYEESNDAVVNLALNFIYPQIDAMQESYEKKVNMGRNGGRPSTLDNKAIWEMAHSGINGSEIAERLGVPKTTVYSSRGWKMRKLENYEN